MHLDSLSRLQATAQRGLLWRTLQMQVVQIQDRAVGLTFETIRGTIHGETHTTVFPMISRKSPCIDFLCKGIEVDGSRDGSSMYVDASLKEVKRYVNMVQRRILSSLVTGLYTQATGQRTFSQRSSAQTGLPCGVRAVSVPLHHRCLAVQTSVCFVQATAARAEPVSFRASPTIVLW